jgi:hypothetical protein
MFLNTTCQNFLPAVLSVTEDKMEASQTDIKRHDPVWVWDGCWLPAVIADVLLEPGKTRFVVQFEHGVSAPVSRTNVEPRNPGICGADKP